jgi:dihydropyrimidinase
MGVMAARGGMLQVHCEDPVLIDAAVADALQRGNTLPRYHAATRPNWAEAAATHRAMAFAQQAEAPVHVVHLSCASALDAVRAAKAAGADVHAETCPHNLALTDDRYAAEDPVDCARYVISPPLRSPGDQDALWAGLADGTLDLVATDHVPDRVGVEKAEAGRGVPFSDISNGAPGIETLLSIVWSHGVARGRLTPERAVDLLATTPARLFGLRGKGAVAPGLDADLVLWDPAARRRLTATDLHHTSDYTPYEGFELSGAVQSVWVRGSPVIRDGAFVGRRGHGRFVERSTAR